MMKKYFIGLLVTLFAFGILSISVFRSASVNYLFTSPTPASKVVLGTDSIDVNYQIPYPGGILPDSPLWAVKALRDKIWLSFTSNPLKKAELALLFSDKRLEAGKLLFEKGKPDIALSTLSKGEKYLESAASYESLAKSRGMNTDSFLHKLATSALKHRQVIEEDILPLSPEDARPEVVKVENYSKNTYKAASILLNNVGMEGPESPFSGD